MEASGVPEEDQHQPLAREGDHLAPSIQGAAFHCMHCGVLATQSWEQAKTTHRYLDYWLCICSNCQGKSLWKGHPANRAIDPIVGGGPRPHPETPQDVRFDYEEARTIVGLSPRGACALLRLAVQKLCKDLGQSGKDINEDIRKLVENGLDADVQEALDSLRVIGNNAVHPGELDLKDDTETATALFSLLNFIVDDRIAQPKKRKAIFAKLPARAVEAIKKRDGAQLPPA